ncbi:hypothetical protein M501DRAFT_141399 [Patellaria atrata CBS 101060]|uniref:PARP catalytic domain-containing protein n=1 Tax=Patellaria atrata CBS 101060 TaxID=1346257 RepID=A0A9P4S844_9PEZI|nr:hypothetical protein M501DRAFT_141399 [Patellaria atrata CBS 101060]
MGKSEEPSSMRKWHSDVIKIAAKHQPINSKLEDFPLEQLCLLTNSYLRLQGVECQLSSNTGDIIASLLQDHSARVDARNDAAIVATIHLMPRSIGRACLRSVFDYSKTNSPDVCQYLRTIVLARIANPTVVDQPESNCAQALLDLFRKEFPLPGPRIQDYFKNLREVECPALLLFKEVHSIPRKSCVRVRKSLLSYKQQQKWLQAFIESRWMTELSQESPVIHILDAEFPEWRIWSKWRPNTNRISNWEDFTNDQRRTLVDIIALEGPDYAHNTETSLRHGLSLESSPSQMKTLLIDYTSKDYLSMADHILAILDRVQQSGGPAINFFIQTCVGKPVTSSTLSILELLCSQGEPEVFNRWNQLVNAKSNSVKLTALSQVLPLIDCNTLSEIENSPLSSKEFQDVITYAQTALSRQLHDGRSGSNLGMKLCELGHALQNSPSFLSSLDEKTKDFVDLLPDKDEIKTLFDLRESNQLSKPKKGSFSLEDVSRRFLLSRLCGVGTVDSGLLEAVNVFLAVESQRPDSIRKAISLMIVQRPHIDKEIRQSCLDQLKYLRDGLIERMTCLLDKDTDMACVHFASLIAEKRSLRECDCWKRWLRCMIEQRGSLLLRNLSRNLPLKSWFKWIENLELAFGPMPPRFDVIPTINEGLFQWSTFLWETYGDVLVRLQARSGARSTLDWILLQDSEMTRELLSLMDSPPQDNRRPIYDTVVKGLLADGRNAVTIRDSLSQLTKASKLGVNSCLRLAKRHEEDSEPIAATTLAIWLQSEELTPVDRALLQNVAALLNIRSQGTESSSAAIFAVLKRDFADILEKGRHLEYLRRGLTAHDAARTNTLIKRLEGSSHTEDAFINIPSSHLDVIEQIDTYEFELVFPLLNLKPLRAKALAIDENVRMLILRLRTPRKLAPVEFCVHFHPSDDEAGDQRHRHRRVTIMGKEPQYQSCSARDTRTLYQVNRLIVRLLSTGFESLKDTYEKVAAGLDSMNRTCIICGKDLGAKLWRSTTCSVLCYQMFNDSPIETLLNDLYMDPPVVDLLLTAVFAAAKLKRTDIDLLDGCPISRVNLPIVLDGIPPIHSFGTGYYRKLIRRLDQEQQRLLSWVCNNYQGFILSAPSSMRVPSMPGTQFILANGNPERERAFAAHVAEHGSQVVFHGTSMDRLYSILRHGLLITTDTPLMVHGAVAGVGIYLADEPSKSLVYSPISSGWSQGSFSNVLLLLGVELAGPVSVNEMYVISDPTRIMVRYIFMCPAGSQIPIAAHITPAMQITFNMLRSGLA